MWHPPGKLFAFTLAAAAFASRLVAEPPSPAVQVELKLRTGGSMMGPVVDFNEHALVVVHDRTPYVFAWMELEAGSAYPTMKRLLAFRQGGEAGLTAEDHVRLGLLASQHGRNNLAAEEFGIARQLAPKTSNTIIARLAELTRGLNSSPIKEVGESDPLEDTATSLEAFPAESPGPPGHDPAEGSIARRPLPPQRDQVLAAYRTFGAKVQEVLGRDIAALETEHFLIWTDWEPRYREPLSRWLEATYETLCQQFRVSATENVFLAKCPVFCFRSRGRFQRFARDFDGHDAKESIGYTRSIEANGHVHVVLLRQGKTPADFDRFAWTLVHESTHAVLHRLYSSRLIPHWVNEGLAELTAERVLGDRCPAGETTDLLAQVYARFDRPIIGLLESAGPIEVYEYPIAHGVVKHLEAQGRERLAGFLRSLKHGADLRAALATAYDGLSLEQLDRDWRDSLPSSRAEIAPPRLDAGQVSGTERP
jgi:hypothetical protein